MWVEMKVKSVDEMVPKADRQTAGTETKARLLIQDTRTKALWCRLGRWGRVDGAQWVERRGGTEPWASQKQAKVWMESAQGEGHAARQRLRDGS